MKIVLFKNFSWLAIDKILKLGLGLAVTSLLARYLGPESFGVLNYALVYVFFFSVFSSLGLDQIIVRNLSRDGADVDKIVGTGFFLKLIGAVLAIILIVVSLVFVETTIEKKILILIIASSMVFKASNIFDCFFQSRMLSKYITISRSTAYTLSSMMKLLFIYLEMDLYAFALLILLDSILGGLFIWLFFWRVYTESRLRILNVDFSVVHKLLRDSWPIALAGFLVTLHLKVDQIMIAHMLSDRDLGIYSLSVTISEAWYFVPLIISSTMLPYLTKLRERDKTLYERRFCQLYSLMFWLGIAMGVIIVIVGRQVIQVLFGEPYSEVYYPLVVNVWAGVFVAQSYAKTIWDIGENLQIYRILSNTLSLIINVIGNALLIPTFGITGAAFATLATRCANNWVFPLFYKPLRQNTILSIKSVNPWYLLSGSINKK